MARFQLRNGNATQPPIHGERAKSPQQVETYDRGWVCAGVGEWVVIDPTPGRRPLVMDDPTFRRLYEPLDADAQKALDAGAPGTAQREPGYTPAPPAHTAAQNLQPLKSAAQAAAEGQGR